MRAVSLFVVLSVLGAGCAAPPAADSGVLVFGGTGRTGVEIVRQLHTTGVPVTVFVRQTSDRSSIELPGVEFAIGDAMHATDVATAFASGRFRAVISAIGRRRGEPRPDYVANANIVRAAQNAGVPRMILISSMGAGNSRAYLTDLPEFMREVLEAKTRAEDELIASDLAYTIIRPGRLRDDPMTGNAELSEDVSIVNKALNRADLAALTVRVWRDAASIDRIYHAFDSSLDSSSR